MTVRLEPEDRAIIEATQAGLPLLPRPYAEIGVRTGLSENDVLERIARMLATGVIRRIGIVPNHYALGLTHNAMTVWDVDDAKISQLGRQIGALPFVTHCYQRPRHLPQWPYNLFAMVHGADRAEVDDKVAVIADMVGGRCRRHTVLHSTAVLKKTGLRLAA